MILWMNKVLPCPSAEVALMFHLYCCKDIYMYLYISKTLNLRLLIKMRNTAEGKAILRYWVVFFSTCELFPSLWKMPLDLLKEKHLFPGESRNTYQTVGKKKKKEKNRGFFCSSWRKKKYCLWPWALHSKLEILFQKWSPKRWRWCSAMAAAAEPSSRLSSACEDEWWSNSVLNNLHPPA